MESIENDDLIDITIEEEDNSKKVLEDLKAKVIEKNKTLLFNEEEIKNYRTDVNKFIHNKEAKHKKR
jgi:hypothetical protein